MRRSALVRHSVAAVAAATVFAGLGPLVPTATAAEGDTVVFPAATAAQSREVIPLSAGPGGYLRYEQGLGHFWSTWAGVETVVHNDREGPETGGTYGAGSDVVAAYQSNGPLTPADIRLWDVTAGKNAYLRLPSFDHTYVGTYGSTVVTFTRSGDDAPREWHLLRLVGGSVQDTPVTGWPEGATHPEKAVAGDANGILISYQVDGVSRPAWIDLASARVRTVPLDANARVGSAIHTPTEVVVWTKDGTVRFFPKGQPGGEGPLVQGSTLDLPYTNDGDVLLGAVDLDLVVARATHRSATAPYSIVTASRLGGRPGEILPYARKDALATPDGGLLVVGGMGPDELGLYRHSPEGPSTTTQRIREVRPLTSKVRRMVFSHGRLDSLERMPDEKNSFRARTVSVGGPLEAGQTQERGDLGLAVDACTDAQWCDVPRATGDGRLVVNDPSSAGLPVVVEPGAAAGHPISAGFTAFDVFDVSGRYALGAGRDANGFRTTVIDLDTGKPTVTFAAGYELRQAELYGDTLWVPGEGATAGKVIGYDVRTGAVKRTVDPGVGCRVENVRVTAHWLGWDCATGAAGIFDLDTDTNRPFGEGYSVLGDGYTVRNTGDGLQVTDFRGTEPTPKGTYRPSHFNDESGEYAVDTATGRLAYQSTAAGDVSVVDLGVPASPLARIDADVPATADGADGAGTWKPRWWLSKPAASWRLTLTHKATGAVARTLTGGEARGVLAAAWDGKDGAGRPVANGSYTWKLTAEAADGAGADLEQSGDVLLSGASAAEYGTFAPLTPTRLMDTRAGLGVPKAKLGPGRTVSLDVAGAGGVPAKGVTAVVLNVTATNASSGSYVSVYPSGTQRTSASNLNFTAGRTVPNLVVVPVVDGKVDFYNHAGSVDLLADVAGYYTSAGTGTTYRPVTPARLMDTRSGLGAPKAKVGPAGTVSLAVPEPGATAVVLNVTATGATAGSFVSVYPYGTQRTAASNLNFTAGQTVPNLVVVPVKDGKVTFYNRAGSVDLLADVAGYFKPGASGAEYKPVTPARLMDTRTGAPLGAGGTVSLPIDRPGATAVVLNVTATGATAGSFVSVYPYGTQRTAASNLNFTAGQTVPNLVVVPVKDGKVTFYNRAGSVHLLADIAGYYVG
ncbi:FlgD immunoglobulin-like domain containing protein [Streptomyces showdoensis]|uniref:FlgD immunoglobulin-like domain containing protein n=1 Tax=Streptomyces showdoensis TaxID=68268 RepID=UPI000F5080E6|nr:FlgD immunoglobulin-like domain containing protein [Streptomyces showdoensis]